MIKKENINLTPELIKKIENSTTPEEIIAIGKEYDVEVSVDEAEEILSFLDRELSDSELDAVAGGVCKDNFCYCHAGKFNW